MLFRSNEGTVRLTSMGGASSLGFRSRGKWWNGSIWQWTNYGPTTNVTTTGTNNIVYYMQSMSASMPMNVAFRNNAINLTTPRVVGVWNHR